MKRGLTILWLLALASVSPIIFPIAESDRTSMDVLAKVALLPSLTLLLVTISLLYTASTRHSRESVLWAWRREPSPHLPWKPSAAELLAGFHARKPTAAHGCAIAQSVRLRPSLPSDITGWADHFWNGASFGLIYVSVFGTCRRWVAASFTLLLGVGFMFSPVVAALGVGFLGLMFSKRFPAIVTLAHPAFGSVLDWLASEWLGFEESPLLIAIRQCFPRVSTLGDWRNRPSL